MSRSRVVPPLLNCWLYHVTVVQQKDETPCVHPASRQTSPKGTFFALAIVN